MTLVLIMRHLKVVSLGVEAPGIMVVDRSSCPRGRVRQVFGGVGTVLTDRWQRRWPDCPPVAYKLRGPYRGVCVRFHSLPESKRYAEDETEYAIVLGRYNTILDELFAGGDVYVITPVWTTEAAVPPVRPARVGSGSYECYTTLGPSQAHGRAGGCVRRSR